MPPVSVIIPVFNAEPYVERCARSLFGQTLRDIEFIFVDDCSTDKSMEIIRQVLDEFPSRKEQVTFFRMKENSGQAKVRMQGLSLAKGDYVIHCDADDCVEADAYEIMYSKALSGDFDMVLCDFRMGDGTQWKECSTLSERGKELSDILLGKVMGSLWFRMVRRSLTLDLIPPAGNMAEDMVLSIQMTAAARSIAHIDRPLYSYCVRPDSISHAPGMEAALSRHESMYANARICVNLLQDRYGFNGSEVDMVLFKYRIRHYLEPYVQEKKVYERWLDTFPEVNSQLLNTPGVPFDVKFWFILIRLRLYHPWKVLSGKHPLK